VHRLLYLRAVVHLVRDEFDVFDVLNCAVFDYGVYEQRNFDFTR
jgi:hypothetical protein